jgi:hypothetical protein
MQPGFVEAVSTAESEERKAFWSDQLLLAGLDHQYHAVARSVPGFGWDCLGIFIAEGPVPEEPAPLHAIPFFLPVKKLVKIGSLLARLCFHNTEACSVCRAESQGRKARSDSRLALADLSDKRMRHRLAKASALNEAICLNALAEFGDIVISTHHHLCPMVILRRVKPESCFPYLAPFQFATSAETAGHRWYAYLVPNERRIRFYQFPAAWRSSVTARLSCRAFYWFSAPRHLNIPNNSFTLLIEALGL